MYQNFKDFIRYIKSNPQAAAELCAAIGVAPKEPEECYISSREAARIIGKSGEWLRTHRELFDVVVVKIGSMTRYKYLESNVRSAYNEYIKAGVYER